MFSPGPKWLSTVHPYLQIILGIVLGLIAAILLYIISNTFNLIDGINDINLAFTIGQGLGGLNIFLAVITLGPAILINIVLPLIFFFFLFRKTTRSFSYSLLLSFVVFFLAFLLTNPALLQGYYF